MVTLYVPPLTELNEQVRDSGLFGATVPMLGQLAVKVLGCETGGVIDTLPFRPPILARFRVEVALEPDWNPIVVGLAENEKSSTATVTWMVWVIAPFVPVIVTV